MKQLFVVLVSAFLAAPVLAHEGEHQDISGVWRTERPTTSTPYVVSYGEILIEEGRITYESTCSYDRGPVVKAAVDSAIEMKEHSFTILETRRLRTEERGYSCEAYLSAGHVEFHVHGDKLVLSNRRIGWRMVFIR